MIASCFAIIGYIIFKMFLGIWATILYYCVLDGQEETCVYRKGLKDCGSNLDALERQTNHP